MSEENEQPHTQRPPVGNLTDFVIGADDQNPLDIEVAVKDNGHVILFHNKPFKNNLSWMEFDLVTNELDFVLDDGDIRDAGLPLTENVAKYMQNTHQILTILLDDSTGEATEGNYIPLIIHRS